MTFPTKSSPDFLAVLAGLIIAASLPAFRQEFSKQVSGTPASRKAAHEAAFRKSALRHQAVQPALKNVMDGDYRSALAKFNKLESQGLGQFHQLRAMCYFHLNEPLAGLETLHYRVNESLTDFRGRSIWLTLLVQLNQNDNIKEAILRLRQGTSQINSVPQLNDAKMLLSSAITMGVLGEQVAMKAMTKKALEFGLVDKRMILTLVGLAQEQGDFAFARQLLGTLDLNPTFPKE